MDKFESQFEDVDVQTTIMEGSINNSTATSMPQDEVDTLINQVADENGIELDQRLAENAVAANPQLQQQLKTPPAAAAPVAAADEDRLAERLRALRPAT